MPTAMTFNNKAITFGSTPAWLSIDSADPYNPLGLPPHTMRFQFSNTNYDPTTESWTAPLSSWSRVSSTPNVWDYTNPASYWGMNFSNKFTSPDNNVQVLGANFSGVTDASSMFYDCTSLNNIVLFDTSNLSTSFRMFANSGVTESPSFNLENCTNIQSMFSGCGSLTRVGELNPIRATNAAGLFYQCTSLNTINSLDLRSASTINSLCFKCSSLTESPRITTSNLLTDISGVFSNCTNLSTVNVFNTQSVTNASDAFSASGIIELPAFDFSSVTNAHSMFFNSKSLQNISSSITFGQVTDAKWMFNGCSSLTSIPSTVSFASVTDTNGMFYECRNITSIPAITSRNITNCRQMFYNCYKVTTGALALYNLLSTQSTPPTNHTNCFYHCGSQTQTGQAELAQIPTDWGGNYVDGDYMPEI